MSALGSAIVDNIPYTATAIPIVERMIATGLDGEPLWWALALGACLGGNLTIVGASANIVVANLAARDGHPITFGQFLRYGSVVVLMSLAISTAYLWLRYLGKPHGTPGDAARPLRCGGASGCRAMVRAGGAGRGSGSRLRLAGASVWATTCFLPTVSVSAP